MAPSRRGYHKPRSCVRSRISTSVLGRPQTPDNIHGFDVDNPISQDGLLFSKTTVDNVDLLCVQPLYNHVR